MAVSKEEAPYLKALSMNSKLKNASRDRTATSISTNTMPKATMRSLAASLLMSQGMLCNVTDPEALGHEGGGAGQISASLVQGTGGVDFLC